VSRFSYQASYFSFSLARWVRALAGLLPTKRKKMDLDLPRARKIRELIVQRASWNWVFLAL